MLPDPVWAAVTASHKAGAAATISGLLSADADRPADFAATLDTEEGPLRLDYARVRLDRAARAALLEMADAVDLAGARARLLSGAHVNATEDRAALHTALRALDAEALTVDGVDVLPALRKTHERLEAFADGVRGGAIAAADGRPFTDVVNIGIGGSDLGPAMAARALSPYVDGPRLHYVSNIDPAHLADTLASVDIARTRFLVASKTFTTLETMTNAAAARARAEAVLGPGAAGHFAAISSADARAVDWGIAPERVFGFPDWVGGRYSLWGPIGLSLMIGIGPARFARLLAGAAAMDRHFATAPWGGNLPVLLALIGLWHAHLEGHATRAVIPYDQRLELLPAYLQQLEMESNGKSVRIDGRPLDGMSVPVVWGAAGTNGQHAFFQALHQGRQVVPVEFLLAARGHEEGPEAEAAHVALMANCLAQAEALATGRSAEAALAGMRAAGMDPERAAALAPHRAFPGNRPSVLLLYPRLTPYMLGALLALYEHRTFVEGAIMGLNSFDQWGVELGKERATALVPAFAPGAPAPEDPASAASLAFLKALRDG